MKSWKFQSDNDVQRFWLDVREVPARIDGRGDRPEERYCLGVYLLALARHRLLAYPFSVSQGNRPDFVFTWESGQITGLEVTRATEQWLQREMTAGEREWRRRQVAAAASGKEAEPVVIPLSAPGWVGDEAEEQWCALVRRIVEAKIKLLPSFRTAERHDLLVYDDTPLPAVDRRKVLAGLAPWARGLKQAAPTLGKTSVIISLDLLFDVGGESRLFPYIEWSEPERDNPRGTEAFSDRVEHAGRVAASQAIRAHELAGAPIYYLDSRGRLVRQTSDGRRFEVRVAENGEEVTVRELPPR